MAQVLRYCSRCHRIRAEKWMTRHQLFELVIWRCTAKTSCREYAKRERRAARERNRAHR